MSEGICFVLNVCIGTTLILLYSFKPVERFNNYRGCDIQLKLVLDQRVLYLGFILTCG